MRRQTRCPPHRISQAHDGSRIGAIRSILPMVHPWRAISVRLNSYQGQAEAIEETATQMPHHRAEDNTTMTPQAAAGLSGTMVS